jgi:hypothetical protein
MNLSLSASFVLMCGKRILAPSLQAFIAGRDLDSLESLTSFMMESRLFNNRLTTCTTCSDNSFTHITPQSQHDNDELEA